VTVASPFCARSLLRFAAKVAPPERRVWFDAMIVEMDHMPVDARLGFALGGFIAAIRERIASPAFILASTRWLLVGGAMAWAAMHLWFAERIALEGASSLKFFTYCVAVIFMAGGIVTVRFGLKVLAILGAPVIFLFGIAAAGINMLLPDSQDTTLYLALIAEDIFVLLVATLMAFAASRFAEHGKVMGQ
jgi:hypothetical protein